MNPKQSFDDVAAVLERSRFFDMRMAAPKCCVIDGPEDSITVIRCNVTTTLATVSEGGLANLEDAQSKVFLRLEDQLRRTIFAEKWATPTPGPD